MVEGILQDLLTRNAINFQNKQTNKQTTEKQTNYDMIVIHIGILNIPCKRAERGLIFFKYSFLQYFWDP